MADAEIIRVYAVKRKREVKAKYRTEAEKPRRARQRADPLRQARSHNEDNFHVSEY